MVVKVLDVVPACNTAAQGAVLADRLRPLLATNKKVTLSFSGVSDVPSSFINASIVALFAEFPEEALTRYLAISNVTSQISHMIRRCLANSRRGAAAA